MNFLTKEMMKANCLSPEIVKVEIPEEGGFIYVRKMAARHRDVFEAMTIAGAEGKVMQAMDNYRAKFIAMTACDEQGNLIFAPADAEWLGLKDSNVINRIFVVARDLNSLTVEDAEKNLNETTEDASVSS